MARTHTRTEVPYAANATRASGRAPRAARVAVPDGAVELVVPLTFQRATTNFTVFDAAETAPVIISRSGLYVPNAMAIVEDDEIEIVIRRRTRQQIRPARKAATGAAKTRKAAQA